MNTDLVGLAFAAGMVAALNPCGFAMLPAYLTLVIQRDGDGPRAAVLRALAATAMMALGFVAVFAVFGTLTVSLATVVQRYLPYVTVVVGILLVALGCWLLAGREIRLPAVAGKTTRWAPTARLGSLAGYGAGYALASLSCTAGPFLAVTGSSLRSGSPAGIALVYLAYIAGIALVVGALAIAVALASSAVIDRMRALLPYVNRASGLILLLVGLYVAYYGWFEIRLLTGGGAADPVIAAAGRLQGALAGWVHRHGAAPWLALLGILASAALVGTRLGGRRTTRGRDAESVPARVDQPR